VESQAVWHLSVGPRRFAELRNLLRGVNEKVLTAQLRELEKDGVVTRTALRSSPPKVTYSLSPSGQTLVPLLEDLCDWGSKQFEINPNLPRNPAKKKLCRARSRARPMSPKMFSQSRPLGRHLSFSGPPSTPVGVTASGSHPQVVHKSVLSKYSGNPFPCRGHQIYKHFYEKNFGSGMPDLYWHY